MKTIVVSVTNDLVTDQRVYKVCNTLQKMGFKIHLVGRKLKSSLPISRDYKTTRMRLLFHKGVLFYAEYNIRLFLLLCFAKKDVLLANDLDTLLPNFLISKIIGKPLVYDSHELFTEVPELIHRPKIQKIWLTIEQFIFPKLKHVFTVNQLIADIYTEKYKVEVKVVKNVPNLFTKQKRPPQDIVSFIEGKQAIIYQGAVNIGRGIELMIDAIVHMENTVLCIFGGGDVFGQIQKIITTKKVSKKIMLYGKVTPSKLKQITPLFDVGLSFEEDLGKNYKYALPNKIFDYINAEIPCLVSNLPEMKKIVSTYEVGAIIKNRTSTNIAIQIQEIINFKNTYKEKTIFAKSSLNWEKEAEIIQQVYTQFL